MHPVAAVCVCVRERERGRELRCDLAAAGWLAGWQESDLRFGHFVLHCSQPVNGFPLRSLWSLLYKHPCTLLCSEELKRPFVM